MKSLWKIFAVLLLLCCQVSLSQNAADKSEAPASRFTCSGAGGFDILSKISGVDFSSYARDWFTITDLNWLGLIPKDARWPTQARGQVQIRLRILPDGKVNPHYVVIEASSGNRALDHAALKAIKKSKYPPLPQKFQEPYLEVRACFSYNLQSPEDSGTGNKAPRS